MVEIKQKPRLHASWIDPQAKEIVRTLQKGGYTTYLVGGCVRDLLAGIHPKDFDIATNAEPNQVKRHVRGAYVIGKRFRLVLVKRGLTQFEVATFRRASRPEDFIESEDTTPVLGDNFFGTPEEDALRRDFTINALFYDPVKDELIDFAHGLKDIEAKTLRMIGDPAQRIIEDPIRSLRAIRLSHKIKFQIEPELRAAIQNNAQELAKSILPRRREEYLKFLRLPDPIPALLEMYDLQLMDVLLPSLKTLLDHVEAREVFLQYMSHMPELCSHPQEPTDLYLPLVLAVMRACENWPNKEEFLEKLMKEELGMFKSEQAHILGLMDFQNQLQNTAAFKKRGQRRQKAFLQHESLPAALKVAAFEKFLKPEDYWFWQEMLDQAGEFFDSK